MSAMLKATFRCMKHLWVHSNAKSGLSFCVTSPLDNLSPLPDHVIMHRLGDILARSNEQIGQIMMVRQQWKEIAGEVLTCHTEPLVIKKKVLLVMCDSPAWAQHIGMLTKVLEKQIKDITGIKIQKVEGKFGYVRKPPQKGKTIRVVKKPDIDPEDMKWLKDPKLAEAVRELINLEGSGND